jgi:hypothetical protein
MQAITIAIGKKGIEYFANSLVISVAIKNLSSMTPPNRIIDAPQIFKVLTGGTLSYYPILINLSHGSFINFNPEFIEGCQKIAGEPATGNNFDMKFKAENFIAKYNWTEEYTKNRSYEWPREKDSFVIDIGPDTYSYEPSFKFLNIHPNLSFVFNDNKYQLLVVKEEDKSEVDNPNIPKKSVIQQEKTKCFTSEVSEATSQMIADIDFSEKINEIFPPVFASIDASGKLTKNIIYNFSLAMGTGENGLQFPNNPDSEVEAGVNGEGITIGVTGSVQWIDGDGVAHDYEGEEQVLPVPRVPLNADEQYMNIYISNYEINALFWAYWKDGQLDQKVTPNDLPDPAMLNTETYEIEIPAFEEYDEAPMYAYITPLMAPMNHFQTVYEFDDEAMAKLEKSLPIDQFNIVLKKLEGKIYISIESLDKKLDNYDFSPAERAIIKEDSSKKGMVTDQEVEYRIVIQDVEEEFPFILFNVKMQNLLTDLALGILELTESNLNTLSTNKVPQSVIKKLHTLKGQKYNSADKLLEAIELKIGKDETDNFGDLILGEAVSLVQTMTFEFKAILSSAEFVETTVPDFTKASDFSFLWTSIGRPRYAETMKTLGETGVPIPIMKDFQFLFEDSHLVPEDGYVSIATKVKYNN